MYLDEAGLPMLAEGLPRNQLRSGGHEVRRESILSIASEARRKGCCTVVVGKDNDRVDCEHRAGTDDFKWRANGLPKRAHEISFLLDKAQG